MQDFFDCPVRNNLIQVQFAIKSKKSDKSV